METVDYHSRFGGMWIDRSDWEASLSERCRNRSVSGEEAALVRRFVADGYIILPQAAPLEAIDAFQAAIARGFTQGNPALRYQAHGSQITRPLDGPVDRLGTRVVDSFVVLPEALDLFSSPRLLRFLTLIFDADPLLFQSLSFDQGSQQGLHQDTAYVVVNEPMQLAACWIALQDVQPGSGELVYLPGSHRYPDFDFGFGKKHWRGEPEDGPIHGAWSEWIVQQAAQRGISRQSFLARKGDILIWHADLAHGGAPVTDPTLTRRSLVGHFCPSTCRPNYFDTGSRRTTVRHRGKLAYASDHYDLSALPEPPRRHWLRRLLQPTS
jgi:hypothetical protein